MHGCIDALHSQVGPFDQPDLDLTNTRTMPGIGPLDQSHHRIERLGYVGLYDDSGVQCEEIRLVKQFGECPNCDLEVVVFLHVEVHKCRRIALCRSVEYLAQSVFDVGQRVVK